MTVSSALPNRLHRGNHGIPTGLTHGFRSLAELLARTFGPGRGSVLSATGTASCEMLVDSATIARRITSVPGLHQNTGAAILRQMVRTIGRRCGDGGATGAVLANAILLEAGRSVAAGANPVLVRRGIQRAVTVACEALEERAEVLVGEPALRALATTASDDPELGAVLGEMLDILGPDGAVQVAQYPGAGLVFEYLDGAQWRARPATRKVIPDGSTEATLVEPAVVVADMELDGWEQVRPLFEVALQLADRPPLLIVATGVSEAARAMFDLNDTRGCLVSAPVVLTTPRTQQAEDLADIALLTGATVLSDSVLPPAQVAPGHVGRARRALVQNRYLTLSGGSGAAAEIGERAGRIRDRVRELERGHSTDDDVRDRLWTRQARLLGAVGALKVGAANTFELDSRVETARQTARLLRTAMRAGAVPGGGVAYLDVVPSVRDMLKTAPTPDEACGIDAVCAGLEAPFLQLVSNRGVLEPRVALHRVRELGPGYGVDLATDAYVDMRAAGVHDVAGVLSTALEAAGTTAGTLISAKVVSGGA